MAMYEVDVMAMNDIFKGTTNQCLLKLCINLHVSKM